MDHKVDKANKIRSLPQLKLSHLNIKNDVCSTPSTDTGRHTIRYVATARTKNLYNLLNINDGGDIYTNIDVKLDNLSKHPDFKKLTSIERTDLCHHLLSVLSRDIDDLSPVRVRRDAQMPKLKYTSKSSNLYPLAKSFYKGRRRWKKWKHSWFKKSIILTKFILVNNCDIESLAPKLEEMNIRLDHILIYCIQHKTEPALLKKLDHIDLTLKSIRSYRYPITPGWLKRAAPYIKPSLYHSLYKKETHEFLRKRKRHRAFIKDLEKSIRRKKKRSKKSGIKLPLVKSMSTLTPKPKQTPLPSDPSHPFFGVKASAGSNTLKK